MRLRTFSAANLNSAMGQVRNALGEEAIIVATREEDGAVLVTAAIEEADPEPEAEEKPGEDIVDLIADSLYAHGTPSDLAEALLDIVAEYRSDDPTEALAAALGKMMAFKPLDASKGPLMLIGPPGAGKTIAVAKLATRAHLAGQSVGVISADVVRAGGFQQLAAFTDILEVDLLSAGDGEELSAALEQLRERDVVLIDAPATNPYHQDDMAEIADLIDAGSGDPVLVIAAGTDPVEALDIATTFQELGARRLFVSRVDAAQRLGAILAMAQQGLNLSEMSSSPHIAEGLAPMNAHALASLFLPHVQATTKKPVYSTGTH